MMQRIPDFYPWIKVILILALGLLTAMNNFDASGYLDAGLKGTPQIGWE